ncbi:hypothetical protein LCGC14_0680420 [marine sediment metagenome]|uniref:Uncharacterized protein n=1 Tax=marine sediment metagenome TaxID=412755 RepID=A0A0F9QTC9_9ZZZZ
MGNQKLAGRDKTRMRNLKQYKDLSNEEFDNIFEDMVDEDSEDQILQVYTKEEVEELIDEKLADFGGDYDLSDMKVNDRLVLRNLIRSIISLEDFEDIYEGIRRKPITKDNVIIFDRIAGVMSKLRSDISSMQNDLKLTRKIRKDSREDNFISYLENLKLKARKFYKQKSLHIFCPQCKYLLATVWLLYADSNNTLYLECGNKECNNKFDIELSKLYETENKNLDDVEMP